MLMAGTISQDQYSMVSEQEEKSDDILLQEIAAGNAEAFSILVHRHSDRFYGLAWRLTSNNQEAEDVVQDAFLKLWNAPDAFDSSKGVKFTTWFYRVVSNVAIDRIRKRKRFWVTDDFDSHASQTQGTEESLIDREQQFLLEQAIQRLPEKQRLALNLCFYEGVSNKEAAEIMGVGVKAIESLLMRAKSKLKDMLVRDNIITVKELKNAKLG